MANRTEAFQVQASSFHRKFDEYKAAVEGRFQQLMTGELLRLLAPSPSFPPSLPLFFALSMFISCLAFKLFRL